MRTIDWFLQVKRKCAGMLPVDVYRRLYEEAYQRNDRNILEIGTGRGPGTVCFAAGIMDASGSGKIYAVDQFHQMQAPRPHKYTMKEFPDAVERNVAEYRRNIRDFGVEEKVNIYAARSDQAATMIPTGIRFGILFIDVDGMIDRDLALFYNRLPPGSLIVIDDVLRDENALGQPKHGKKMLERARASDNAARWVKSLPLFDRKRLLGKYFLTKILLDRFVSNGLVELVDIVTDTAFCIKTGPETVSPDVFLDNDAEDIVREKFRHLASQRGPATA